MWKAYLLSLFLLLLSSCTGHYSELETSQHIRLIDSGESLGQYDCVLPQGAVVETGLAVEATLFAFHHYGLIEYGSTALNALGFYSNSLFICWVDSGPDVFPYAGLSQGDRVWVATRDGKNRLINIRYSALPHELVHRILERLCILEDCWADAHHEDPRFWSIGVTGLAEAIWKAAP